MVPPPRAGPAPSLGRNFKGFTTNFQDLHGLKQLPGLPSSANGYGFAGEGGALMVGGAGSAPANAKWPPFWRNPHSK